MTTFRRNYRRTLLFACRLFHRIADNVADAVGVGGLASRGRRSDRGPQGDRFRSRRGRYRDDVLRTEMLLRVIVEETRAELVVVTLYKTSKFGKYEGRRST